MAAYPDAIKTAIESAMQERDQLLEKLKGFDKIKERLGQIEAFINQGRLLIGEDSANIYAEKTEEQPSFRIVRFLKEKTNAEKIAEILKVTGKSMTVPHIVNEFKARNWKLGEKNQMQIIRNTLKSKQGTLFEKVGIGLWDLMDRSA